MPVNACTEHGLVFPTFEKFDLHMNVVHYYPVGMRVKAIDYPRPGTVVGHNEHLGMKVEFDDDSHPEFFQTRELHKLKDQTPFVKHAPANADVAAKRQEILDKVSRPSGEMTAMSHETEGFCFCGTTHKPDSNNAVYIKRIKDEVDRIQEQMNRYTFTNTLSYVQLLGKRQGLEHALLVLGVEIDE